MFRAKTTNKEVYKVRELIDGFVYQDAHLGDYYLVKRGKRYKFVSQRAFESWNLPAIRVASVDIAGSATEYGGILGFRDSTLLENIADGRLYVISNNRRRHVRNPDWLFDYGLLDGDVVLASQSEIEVHEEGDPLD